jgi:hypothetical protein
MTENPKAPPPPDPSDPREPVPEDTPPPDIPREQSEDPPPSHEPDEREHPVGANTQMVRSPTRRSTALRQLDFEIEPDQTQRYQVTPNRIVPRNVLPPAKGASR